MILLHTSDWHLGRTESERSFAEDQKFFIDRICDLIEGKNVDAVLLAGDVYDRSVASAEAIRLYDYAVRRVCLELERPLLMIAGNHDSPDRLASCSDLLSKAGLYVVGSLPREPYFKSFDDAQIFFLPWITEEKVKSVYPEKKEEIETLDDAYRIALDAMRERFEPGKRHIVISHAFITDSETSTSDRSAEIGFATQVSATVFEGFDYVALGHIHKPQDVNGSIRYSGTPMPYSFGKEESQEKSVTLIDTSDLTRTVVPLPLLHERTTLKCTLDELLRGDFPERVRDGYVKLEATDSFVGLEAQSSLRALYPCCLDISGKNYDGANGSVMLSAEEFERIESDPAEIFRHFCMEEIGEAPDEHLTELFLQAVKTAEEEDAQ